MPSFRKLEDVEEPTSPPAIQTTLTESTSMTSPSSPPSPPPPTPGPQEIKIQIEQNTSRSREGKQQQEGKQKSSMVSRYLGPTATLTRAAAPYAFPFFLVYGAFMTVSSGLLFDQFLKIPGVKSVADELEKQVEALEVIRDELQAEVDLLEVHVDRLEGQVTNLTDQVDRLGTEVNRLEFENERYSGLNANLRSNLTLLSSLNDALEVGNEQYRQNNAVLNQTVEAIALENQKFNASLAERERLNDELTSDVDRLETEVDRLNDVERNLTDTVQDLNQQKTELSGVVDNLRDQNDRLDDQVGNLTTEVSTLQNETSTLELHIDELTAVVQFLNTTAADVERTFDATVDLLDQLIGSYRTSAITTTQTYYKDLAQSWRCDLDSAFGSQEFSRDASVPVGSESTFHAVMDYLDEVVLQKMCVDLDDFTRYATEDNPILGGVAISDMSTVTMSHLSSAMSFYFLNLDEHYFSFLQGSSAVESGLTEAEWEAAKYQCSNLPPERVFLFYS